jgi:AcrR family transcriptional regulator
MRRKARRLRKTASSAFEARRALLTGRIADALLRAGVAQIPLRTLAARLRTSDRMLLYYFEDKDELVRCSLREVSGRLAALLALPGRMSADKLLGVIVPLFAQPAFGPFMNVWADLASRGVRGEEPFCALARESVRWWLEWLEQRLDLEAGAQRRTAALAILAVVEGSRLLEASVPGAAAAAAGVLRRGLGG